MGVVGIVGPLLCMGTRDRGCVRRGSAAMERVTFAAGAHRVGAGEPIPGLAALYMCANSPDVSEGESSGVKGECGCC